MNAPRKKSAVNKHFGQPYETLDQMRAGLKADEAGYTEAEIEEIIEGIRAKAAEASGSNPGEQTNQEKATAETISAEDLEEFKVWQAQKKSLKPVSTTELAEAVTKAVPKPSRYKDFDVFQGKVYKEQVANPFNPERPNSVITYIQLGERKRLARIEPALAHEFNEFGIGQESGLNHGESSTAEFYFPVDIHTPGAKISFADFAEFQRQDIRYTEKYHPLKNISLLVASGYGTKIV